MGNEDVLPFRDAHSHAADVRAALTDCLREAEETSKLIDKEYLRLINEANDHPMYERVHYERNRMNALIHIIRSTLRQVDWKF
jgi:GTP1/Obg family GTP-binding protein